MTKSLVYGVTKSQLMTRAWQLARLNRPTATASLKINFGRWLSLAWAEAREGNTALWSVNFSRRNALQHEIDCLGAKDRWDDADYLTMRAFEGQLQALNH